MPKMRGTLLILFFAVSIPTQLAGQARPPEPMRVLPTGVGAVVGGAVGACLGQMSGGCLGAALPKSGLGSLVGLLAGGAMVALAEGTGVVPNRPAFVMGFAVGHALAMKWMWD